MNLLATNIENELRQITEMTRLLADWQLFHSGLQIQITAHAPAAQLATDKYSSIIINCKCTDCAIIIM